MKTALTALCTGLLAVLLAISFAPSTGNAGAFSSDSAIPLLMANAAEVNGYHLFLLGQDRFGAWPFLLGNAAHQLTGLWWTPDALSYALVLALVGSLLPLAWLAGVHAGMFSLLFLALCMAWRPLHDFVLTLEHHNVWQWLCMAWAWWFMRRTLTSEISRRHLIGTAATAFLAIWTSTQSILLLSIMAAAEALREMADRRVWMVRRHATALAFPLVMGSVGAVVVVQLHRFVARGLNLWFQPTKAILDVGNLQTNTVSQWQSFVAQDGHLVVLALLVTLVLVRLRHREDGAALWTFTAGLLGSAGAVLLVNILLSWTRMNAHAPRYQAIAMLSLAAVLSAAFARLAATRWQVIPVVALAVSGIAAPSRQLDPAFARVEHAAQALEERAPDGVLLGDYWGLYRYTAFQREHALKPRPLDYTFDRTGWTVRDLQAADLVIVSHSETERFGPPFQPVPWIYQAGTLLKLESARWLDVEGQVFSRFENMRARLDTRAQVRLGEAALPVENGVFLVPKPLLQDGEAPHIRITLDGAAPTLVVVAFVRPPSDEQRASLPPPQLTADRLMIWPWNADGTTLDITGGAASPWPAVRAVILVN